MRPRTQAWKLLITCLYGRHSWIKRSPQGHITVAIRQLSNSLGRRPETMQADLEYLQHLELIDGLNWHGHFFTAKLAAPPSMAWIIEDKEPIIMESAL